MLKHEHFGKIRPHHHTSYGGLVVALLAVALLLFGMSWATQAAPPAENPQSGSIGLSGTVKGAAPVTGATIVSPRSGARFTEGPITVTGTCPVNTFVTIMKNDVFGGVVPCQSNGTYSILIDLFVGTNVLIARVSDALGQFGPDSASVTVYYEPAGAGSGGGVIGRPLFLQSASMVLGVEPKQTLVRTVTIVGGVGPYAISWDWGDGTSDLSSQSQEGPVRAGHAYEKPGTYIVIVRATDAVGNTALLQLVTVVNGPVAPYGATNGSGQGALSGGLAVAWPLLGGTLVMVLTFWLGRWRGIARERHRQAVA